MCFHICKGALGVLRAAAHVAGLPVAGVSTPNTVPVVNTAPAMTDRLMVIPL